MTSHTDTGFQIRNADKTDVHVISLLAHAIWPDTYGNILTALQLHYMLKLFYSEDSLRKQMDEGHHFLLALSNAETVGFASYSHAGKAGVFKVHKLYVHPMLHGHGFGRKLLDRIIKDISPKGANILQLNVNRHNRAINFYEKYGFKKVGEEDIAIGEGYFMNDFVMEKET
ncbi:MAG: GNAT family N-acetyltransferase [Chitinophagaceae bacterium]|nr:GNAT family N-acetyltransferase [Chitinophagaceae bacterium]